MGSLFFAVFLLIVAVVALFVPLPTEFNTIKKIGAAALTGFAAIVTVLGGTSYNDAVQQLARASVV